MLADFDLYSETPYHHPVGGPHDNVRYAEGEAGFDVNSNPLDIAGPSGFYEASGPASYSTGGGDFATNGFQFDVGYTSGQEVNGQSVEVVANADGARYVSDALLPQATNPDLLYNISQTDSGGYLDDAMFVIGRDNPSLVDTSNLILPGAHQYLVIDKVSSNPQDAYIAFDGLTHGAAAPNQGTIVSQTGDAVLTPFGWITQVVDSGLLSVTNITIPGSHILNPGVVERQVYVDNGGVYVYTYGNGNGWLPYENEAAAGSLWHGQDNQVTGYIATHGGQGALANGVSIQTYVSHSAITGL